MGVAFAGILTIAGTPQVLDHELAFVLAVLGATAWAGSNVYMKVVEQNAIMPLLFWTGLYSLPVTLVVSLLIEGHPWELIETAPASAWIGLTYTVFFSTIAGYGLWYWLITRFSITQVTPFALLVPVGGLSSGGVRGWRARIRLSGESRAGPYPTRGNRPAAEAAAAAYAR
jgi:O-acetylserine/cysteine efflux transporter